MRIFVPEVLYSPERLEFLIETKNTARATLAILVYDFAPYFRPELYRIEQGGASFFIPFLRFIVAANARAFISRSDQNAFQTRILRSDQLPADDIAIPLGADGLPARFHDSLWTLNKVLCIGTFDGKKKQGVVFRAFVSSKLLEVGMKLIMLGSVPPDLPPHFMELFTETPAVKIVYGPSDPVIVQAYQSAFFSVFVGADEGYGLPAVESLFQGVPIVAYAELPSLRGHSAGVVRIENVTVDALRASFDALASPEARENLMGDVALAQIPTWDGFASGIAEWLKSIASESVKRMARLPTPDTRVGIRTVTPGDAYAVGSDLSLKGSDERRPDLFAAGKANSGACAFDLPLSEADAGMTGKVLEVFVGRYMPIMIASAVIEHGPPVMLPRMSLLLAHLIQPVARPLLRSFATAAHKIAANNAPTHNSITLEQLVCGVFAAALNREAGSH